MTITTVAVESMSTLIGEIVFADQRDIHRRYRDLFTDPIFDTAWHKPDTSGVTRAYARYHHLLSRLPRSLDDLLSTPTELIALHEWSGIVDPVLAAILTVQINLAAGSLWEQRGDGPCAEQLREMQDGRALGAYVLTELGHGSDINNIETVAEYDTATKTFMLSTPTATAVKIMPTTPASPLPEVSRFGVVFARLLSGGTDHGVYPFLLQLADADGVVTSGVTIHPLPLLPSGFTEDNALTRFDGVRLDRACLMSPTGTQITDDGQLLSPLPRSSRAWRALSRVRWGRLCVAGTVAAGSRAALWIAVRHARQRDIAALDGGRIALIDTEPHTANLVDQLCDVYIATLAVRDATEAMEAAEDQSGARITDRIALVKHLTTTVALHTFDEVRDRLGAQGMFSHNRIVEYRAGRDAAATAEGDSYVIALQAAYRRLSLDDEWIPGGWDPRKAFDDDTAACWLEWMRERERYLHHRARDLFYRNTETNGPQAGWDASWQPALAAAQAHITHVAAESLYDRAIQLPQPARRVVEDMVTLFAVRQCLSDGAALLPDGPLPNLSRPLADIASDLRRRLTPHLVALTDAFDIPDGLLRTPFESPDGFISDYAAAVGFAHESDQARKAGPLTSTP